MDVSDIFYFFCSGEGRGSPRRQEGGGGAIFLWKIPGEGVSWVGGCGGGGGAGRVFAGNLGRGGKYFFFWAEIPTKLIISGPQKGPVERGHIKNRQKVSKMFSTAFDIFRAGLKTSKIAKKCQKIFWTLFDNFRAAPVFRTLMGGSDKITSA